MGKACVSCDMLVRNGGLDGMMGVNHRVENNNKRTDRNRPSEQGEGIHRIDKDEIDEYICVSCDMLRRLRNEKYPKPGIYKTDL